MVFSNNLLMGAAAAATSGDSPGYVPAGAMWFDKANLSYMSKLFTASPTGAGRKWTFSVWLKRTGEFTSGQDQGILIGHRTQTKDVDWTDSIKFITKEMGIVWDVKGGTSSSWVGLPMMRDPTSWFNYCIVCDTTQAVDYDRWRVFLNGKRIEETYGTATYPSLNEIGKGITNNLGYHEIGRMGYAGYTPLAGYYYNGYMSELILLDGYVGNPTDFGEVDSNGEWRPIDPSSVVSSNKGNNGFHLDFADSSDLGNDVSGNNNDFTLYNITSANYAKDRPADDVSNNIGNYATWSLANTDSNVTLSLGAQVAEQDNTAAYKASLATIGVTSGKWVWEVHHSGTSPFAGWSQDGIAGDSLSFSQITGRGDTIAGTAGFDYLLSGTKIRKFFDGTFTDNFATGVSQPSGNALMYLLDADAETLAIRTSNTTHGTAQSISGITKPYTPYCVIYQGGSVDLKLVTTESDFVNSVPAGDYKTLNTGNLPEPTVKDGEKYFLPMVYEGNGGGQRVGNFIPFTDSHAVDNSCLFDGSSDYMNKTFSTSGTNRKKFTFSCWFKLGTLGVTETLLSCDDTSSDNEFMFWVESGGNIRISNYVGGSNKLNLITHRLFLDVSTWYNLVLEADSTPSTPSISSIKLYINGSQIPSSGFSTETYPTQNFDFALGGAFDHEVGRYALSDNNLWNGYISEMVFIDGTCYDASSFGQTDTATNRWIPKDVSGLTFGTNGFYLEFETSSNLGDDTSGNTNDFTVNNIVAANQTIDTPTKNFATLSPSLTNGNGVVSNGNLHFTVGTTSNSVAGSTIGVSSGKFYGEAKYTSGSAFGFGFGFANNDSTVIKSGSGTYLGESVDSWGINASNGNLTNNGSIAVSSYAGGALSNGTTYMWCLDMDNGKWWAGNADTNTWFTNGSVGNPATGANPGVLGLGGTIHICASAYNGDAITMNFGQTTLVNASNIPTGFKVLNQDNLAESTDGITGFSWIKNRDATDNHILQDRVMGIYNYISSNVSDLQATDANSVQKFLQQGVQIGNMNAVNTAAESYVLWQWAANGTGTLNELGSIDSYVSANTDAGFSIVKYTGTGSAATVGHGLSSSPSVIFNKTLGSGSTDPNWQIYHVGMGPTKAMFLNTTGGPATSSTYWNNTAPTTTAPFVFSIGTDRDSATDYINYCFAEVEGYSKFGTYTGNGDDDGAYVYLGFKPSWVMIKRQEAGYAWHIQDEARSIYNPTALGINANDTGGDSATTAYDFTGNGFKLRRSGGGYNGSGASYIYLAFASNPFGGSGVGQAKAR
tara:strand:- start:996 stop:4835 length:3840 start_codon:yes stop_codon:yes gene_type:complete